VGLQSSARATRRMRQEGGASEVQGDVKVHFSRGVLEWTGLRGKKEKESKRNWVGKTTTGRGCFGHVRRSCEKLGGGKRP